MSYKEIYELSNELYAERFELVEERIEQIVREPAIEPAFADYFRSAAKCINTIKNHSADKEFNDLFYSQFDKENYEKYWDDISPFIKYGCIKDTKFADKMGDYVLFKNLDGKYLTLKECLEENKEKHENTVFYVTDEIEQSQYINFIKNEGIDAVILTHNIDQPFITNMESKNENLKFKRIDADLSDSFKEETSKDELKDMTEKLSKTFKDALGNENLTVSVEKLKDASISSMITLSEESRRMQDMMKMYGMAGMDPNMFGAEGQTLVLNANNDLVKYVAEHADGENTKIICEQLYDLAMGMSRREHVHSYFHQEISAEGTSVGNQGRFLARHEVYLLYLIFLIRVKYL